MNKFAEDDAVGRDPFAGPPPKFKDFAERWMREYVEVNNRLASRRSKEYALRVHLLPAFGTQSLDDITTARIDAFAAKTRAAGRSPKTVNNLLSMLRCALVIAVRWGLLRHAPDIRWLRVPSASYTFLSAQEVSRVLAATPPGYWRTLVTFIARTGVRFGEAAALRWEDLELDLPHPVAHIRRGVSLGIVGPTKTGRLRDVPIGPDVGLALRTFRHDRPYLFALSNGSYPHPATTLKYLHRFCDKAGVRRISWHVLRHSFATELTARGASLRTVQDLLGHTTLQMTARYLHVAPSMLHEAVTLLYADPRSGTEWSPNGHQDDKGIIRSPGPGEVPRPNIAQSTEKPAIEAGSSMLDCWSG